MASERVSTGVEKLDEMLSGGFPANSSIILMGPPGAGKSTLLNQFVRTGLEEGEKDLYITLDSSPDDVTDSAEYFGWDIDSDDLLFIDGYSWREGQDVETDYAIKGPSDLNQMNMTLADAMEDLGTGRKRVVLDSVSTLVLYTDPQSAVKFLQVVGAKSKASSGCLLMTLEEGVHDAKTISTLNYVADGMIQMKMDGDTRMLSIQRMQKTEHTRDWYEFEIEREGEGINILGKAEEQ